MSCNNYRITNTSEKIVYFNYQRCDNSSWEYQNQLLPGQSNNFYAIDGTVSYPSFYQGFIQIQLLGVFPSNDTLVPNPPPYNIKQDCYRFTVSNPHIKEQTISYVNCEGLNDYVDIGGNSTLRFLCAKFVYQNPDQPLDIDYEYFEPNEDCPECSTCYPWQIYNPNSCYTTLIESSQAPLSPTEAISSQNLIYTNIETRFYYPTFKKDGSGTSEVIKKTPNVWLQSKLVGRFVAGTSPCFDAKSVKVGDIITLNIGPSYDYKTGMGIEFRWESYPNFPYFFRGNVLDYNSVTGVITIQCTYTQIEPVYCIFYFYPYGVNIYDGPLNRSSRWTKMRYLLDMLPLRTWIGFSQCLTGFVRGKTYYVGLGGDNYFKLLINGMVIVNSSLKSITETNFRVWHVYPIILGDGEQIIEVFGLNSQDRATFGCEIYDNTLEELSNATSVNDLNIIFTTADKTFFQVAQDLDGNYTSLGYRCPTGYVYNGCNNECVKTIYCERNCLRSIDTQKRLISRFFLNNITCGIESSGIWDILDETIETACELLQNGGGINSGGLIECGLCDGATLGTFSSLQIEYKGTLQIGTKIYEGFNKIDCIPVIPGTYMVIDSTITNNTLLKNYLCDDNQCSKTLITVNTIGEVSDIQTCSICKPCCDFVGSSIFEPGCYCQDSEAFMAIDFFVEVNVQPCVYLSCPQMTVQYQINGGDTITTTGFLWDVDWGSETRYGTQWGCNVYKWAINVQNVTDYVGQSINITYQCTVLTCSFEGNINYSVPSCP